MRIVVLAVVVVVIGLVAGSYAAAQDPPELTPEDARNFTRAALSAVEARNFVVEGDVRAEEFTPEGGSPIPVWVVPAKVSGQQLELHVMRFGDRAVLLNDALPDGGFVLTPEQFERLERFRLDLAGEQVRERRRAPALVAGLLILLVGVALLVSVAYQRTRPADDPAPA